jgi:hypothetical protein
VRILYSLCYSRAGKGTYTAITATDPSHTEALTPTGTYGQALLNTLGTAGGLVTGAASGVKSYFWGR